MDMKPRKKILIADDDKDIALVMQTALMEKFEVLVVHDGVMCLATIMKSPPDLVLLDITMPKMSGYQVMDNMKKNPKLSSIPIILVSAKSSLQETDFGLKKGAVGYLAKPFEVAQLIYMVEKILLPPATPQNPPTPGSK